MIYPVHLRVEDSSHVGEARRLAATLARELGFAETRVGEASIIVTELATNLVKHTQGAGGHLVFSPIQTASSIGLDILSLDQGPGLANIAESLRDGHSITGTPGTGLGAIRRLSSTFDIYSAPGRGAAVFSRLWKGTPPASPPALEVGAVCLPVRGEQACGDAWAVYQSGDTTLLLVADGLGHGPDAAAAANAAVAVFQQHAPRGPAAMLTLIHPALRGTRGAAVAVAELALGRRLVRFAGVGNISAQILDGDTSRHLVSYNGTAGIEVRKIHEFSHDWPAGGLLLMHSDGVATHFKFEDYPVLARKAPALIAGVLFRDHQRLRDDSTVLVAREA